MNVLATEGKKVSKRRKTGNIYIQSGRLGRLGRRDAKSPKGVHSDHVHELTGSLVQPLRTSRRALSRVEQALFVIDSIKRHLI